MKCILPEDCKQDRYKLDLAKVRLKKKLSGFRGHIKILIFGPERRLSVLRVFVALAEDLS